MKSIVLSMALSAFFTVPLHAAVTEDAHITEIMEVANESEVDTGKLAEKRAQTESVKAYAKQMVSLHKESQNKIKKLAKKQKLDFDRTDESKMMKKDTKNKMDELEDKKGKEFDVAYITSQVQMHEKLLSDLDNVLIPAARNADLKTYLQETREHVSAHLNQAKQIQSSLQ